MKILITGGAGFIGSHLADRLLQSGHEVRCLDSLDPQVHPSGRPDYHNPAAELIEGDVRDRDVLGRSLEGVDAVAHMAAAVGVGQSMYEIERYVAANGLGTAILLEEVVNRRDQIQKIVVASSMSCYGEGQYRNPKTGEHELSPRIRQDDQLRRREWELLAEDGTVLEPEPTNEGKPFRPTSVYAVTKRDQEELTLITGRAYGIGAVACRFFNAYGTRQSLSNPYTGVAAIFASRLLNGRPPLVFEDGNQSRDFIDVRDVARGIELALTTDGADGQAINLGTGIATSINDIAVLLGNGLGIDVEPQITGQFRTGDIRHCYADTTRARKLLGFEPEIGIERGLKDLLVWLQGQSPVDLVEHAQEALVSRGLVR